MSADPIVHIVDAELADDAVAALTAVLVALAAENQIPPSAPGGDRAGWRRRDAASGYLSPSSWRS